MDCHDGFTLHDLYSYNEKHNEENGWNNTDGMDDNRSWNCGVEGETDNKEVLALRGKMVRNAFTVLMCSRGTPMFLAGDEFGNTQYGNNNSYCQDNRISWLNWDDLEKNRDLYEFFKFMIAFRKDHPILRQKLPFAICGMEDMGYYDQYGNRTGVPENTYTFQVVFAGYDKEKDRDDVICLALNTYWEPVSIRLPVSNQSIRARWHLAVNTGGDAFGHTTWNKNRGPVVHNEFVMQPRSVAVFVSRAH